MPITIQDLDNLEFEVVKQKYYNANKVNAKLDEIKAGVRELIEENARLRSGAAEKAKKSKADDAEAKAAAEGLIASAEKFAEATLSDAQAKAATILDAAQFEAKRIMDGAKGDGKLPKNYSGKIEEIADQLEKLQKQLKELAGKK